MGTFPAFISIPTLPELEQVPYLWRVGGDFVLCFSFRSPREFSIGPSCCPGVGAELNTWTGIKARGLSGSRSWSSLGCHPFISPPCLLISSSSLLPLMECLFPVYNALSPVVKQPPGSFLIDLCCPHAVQAEARHLEPFDWSPLDICLLPFNSCVVVTVVSPLPLPNNLAPRL